MITIGRFPILGAGLGLYLIGLGLLVVAMLNQHDEALRKFRTYLVEPDLKPPVHREANDAPWTGSIRQADAALAQKRVGEAEQAWLSAFAAALKSGRWEGMVETGDMYLRLGGLAGMPSAPVAAKAQQIYFAALFRARRQGSVDGVLRTAEAFAALGDRGRAEHALRIAEALVADGRDAGALSRVHAFHERLGTHVPLLVGPAAEARAEEPRRDR